MSYLEKVNSKLVHFLFPLVERCYYFVPFVVFIAVWSIPETYWPIRVVLFWLWFLSNEIHWQGVAERDCLPLQPGDGLFIACIGLWTEPPFSSCSFA